MSFKQSDFIYILPIYSAGEQNRQNITPNTIVNTLKKKFKNKVIKSVNLEKDLFKDLNNEISKDDNVIFLGAGLSSKIAQRFVKFLK